MRSFPCTKCYLIVQILFKCYTFNIVDISSVISPDPQRCHQRSAFVVTPPSGYLSNYITERTGCGNIDAPWHIQASPGQRINVTLMDFGTVSTGAGGGQQKDSTGGNVCQVLAIIKDRMVSTTETICTGKYRLTNVYYSASHDIEVRMVLKSRRDENGRYALLKYDGIYIYIYIYILISLKSKL